MNIETRLRALNAMHFTRKGDLYLSANACVEWIPGQVDEAETETGTPAEAWTNAFTELFIGAEIGGGELSRKPELLKRYFAALKAFQLDFWGVEIEHELNIHPVVSIEYLEDAEREYEEFKQAKKKAAAEEEYFRRKAEAQGREEVARRIREQPRGTSAEDARRAREKYVQELDAKTENPPEVQRQLDEAEREQFAGEYDHPRSMKQEIRAAILDAQAEAEEAQKDFDAGEITSQIPPFEGDA